MVKSIKNNLLVASFREFTDFNASSDHLLLKLFSLLSYVNYNLWSPNILKIIIIMILIQYINGITINMAIVNLYNFIVNIV